MRCRRSPRATVARAAGGGGGLAVGGGVLGLATRNRGGLRAPNNAGRSLMPRRLSVAENETPDGLRGRLGPAPWEQMSM